MNIRKIEPPRKYRVGRDKQIEISDCARVELAPDEQVTFLTEAGKEYDVARKDWGFYATPSVNGRLKDQGFKTALVTNALGKYYVMLVDPSRMKSFEKYLADEDQKVVEWMDERV